MVVRKYSRKVWRVWRNVEGLREHEPRLDQAILDTAWRGYFGNVAN
jgi:hypothetical protein